MNAKIGLLVMGLSLGGCATASLATIESEIQADAVAACSFLPTATSIATLFTDASIALQAPEAIAAMICAGLSPPAATPAFAAHALRPRAARALPVVTVNGKPTVISGTFTK